MRDIASDSSSIGCGAGASTSSALSAAVLLVLLGFPAIVISFATRHGLGISPDSVVYAFSARTLMHTGQLRSLTGGPLTIYAPGLPILLGVLSRTGLSIDAAARFIDIVSATLFVFGTYLLTRKLFSTLWVSITITALTSLIVPSTLTVFTMLWSEPPFLALTVLILLIVTCCIKRHEVPVGLVIVVIALTVLTTLLRFIGIAIVPALFVSIVIAERSMPLRKTIIKATAVCTASSLGLVAIIIRNLSLGYSIFGNRYDSRYPIVTIFRSSVLTVGSYLFPYNVAHTAAIPGLLVIGLTAVGLIQVLRKRRVEFLPISIYLVIYSALLLYSELTTVIDPVDQRLLTPVVIPIMLLSVASLAEVVAVARKLSAHVGHGVRGWFQAVVSKAGARYAMYSCLIIFLLLFAFQDVQDARAFPNNLGYNSVANQEAPLAVALRRLSTRSEIASNDPYHVYWSTEHGPVLQIPPLVPNYYSPTAQTAANLDLLRAGITSGTVKYLAYFNTGPSNFGPARLRFRGVTFRLVKAFRDGKLYRVVAR
ncbi:MAG: hypothetical protein ACYCST_14635 [Acidimicrobiales bacterium]